MTIDRISKIYEGIEEYNRTAEEKIDVEKTAFAPKKVLNRYRELQKWQRTLKREKLKLIKLVNNLEVWDFSYTENLIFELVKLNFKFYRNAELLERDTNSEQYKEFQKEIEEVDHLMQNLQADDHNHELRQRLYCLLGDLIEKFCD